MLKPEDEEWTAAKLRMLLGRHISTMEMVGSDYETPVMPASNPNHGGHRAQQSHLQLKSTARGLLAGNGHNKGQNPVVFTVLSLTGLMNVPNLAHWKLGRRN